MGGITFYASGFEMHVSQNQRWFFPFSHFTQEA